MSDMEKLGSSLLVVVVVVFVLAAIVVDRRDVADHWESVCNSELRKATPSDSLRIYRLQPKCLP